MAEVAVASVFTVAKDARGKWRVTGVGVGGETVGGLEALWPTVNARKAARAREDLAEMREALEAFRRFRGDAIVVPGRGGRFWVDLTGEPMLDAPVGDPAMGGHAGFGLGLALARPERKVVLFDSEGDILMSLGMLVTIAEQAPANFYHFLLDNECYATTGGQPVPNAKNIAYDKMALAAGYPRAFAFDTIEALSRWVRGTCAAAAAPIAALMPGTT